MLVVWLLVNASTHADVAPEFIEEGVYVALTGRLYPQMFLKNEQGGIQSYVLARKDGVARCYFVDQTMYAPYTRDPAFKNLFIRNGGAGFHGIQKEGEGAYFFFAGQTILEEAWSKTKVKFVRIGDEKVAHQILSDYPPCERLASLAPRAALPPSKPVPFTDPLILDLGNSGVKLGVPRAAVEFDIDSDGFKEKLTWPDDESAYFLVVDRNSNGKIDDGSELFGTSTLDAWGRKHQTGFGALRSFDANDDAWIDRRDGIFESLQLWKDSNRNGKSEPEELHSLCELEVLAIAASCADLGESDDYGNCKTHESYVRMTDKSLRKIYEVVFITPH